jgi:hypothetical protein
MHPAGPNQVAKPSQSHRADLVSSYQDPFAPQTAKDNEKSQSHRADLVSSYPLIRE